MARRIVATDRRVKRRPPGVDHGPPERWQHSAKIFEYTEAAGVMARRVGKDEAVKAYDKALRRASAAQILLGAHRMANDPNLPEKQFIPHPATWLNRGGWQDEPYPAAGRPGDGRGDALREAMARAKAAVAS